MELLMFNESHQIIYFGKCKIAVNSINKTLMVTPLEEVCPHIFDQKIIKQSNLLFIYASSFYMCDFILIFPSIETCNKIFDAIHKSKDTNDSTSTELDSPIFKERFFLPILSGCQTNEIFSSRIKEFISYFLKTLGEEEREKYFYLIKEKDGGFYCDTLTKIVIEKGYKVVDELCENKILEHQLRKRSHTTSPHQMIRSEMDCFNENYQREESEASFSDEDFEEEFDDYNNDNSNENSLPKKRFKHGEINETFEAPNDYDASKQIIHEPNFNIFKYEEFGILKSTLIIFPLDDQEFCYEYSGKEKYYQCYRCQRKRCVIATLYKNENNDQAYVKLSKTEHVCKIIKFDPENYNFNKDKRIVRVPNFKIDSYHQNGVFKKKLFIFSCLEKKMGYDYFYDSNKDRFRCCGCIKKNVKSAAKICQDVDGNDCVKLSKYKHICELRTYGIEKNINYHIIYKPNYEIIEQTVYGITKKKLFIVIQENKNLCYEFTYVCTQESFVCYRCHNGAENQNNIRAYLCYDEDGKEFIRVFDRPHVCKALPYPINNNEDEKIIRQPNFQFLKRKFNGKLIEKLVIFANEEKSLCYEYNKKTKKDFWECWPCKILTKKTISAKLIHGQEEYIELGKHEHDCEPIKFDPEDSQLNIVKKSNFKIEIGRNKNNKETKGLTIFDQKDTTKCFYYNCILGDHLFRCTKCFMKKRYVSANIVQSGNNEEEYLVLNENKHICEMEKYEPLIQNLKIINHPNFYLEKVKTCKGENERLWIKDLNNENKNLLYPYLWNQAKGVYKCNKCVRKGKTVTAKLYKVENGEDYIELSPIQHLCVPEPKTEKI